MKCQQYELEKVCAAFVFYYRKSVSSCILASILSMSAVCIWTMKLIRDRVIHEIKEEYAISRADIGRRRRRNGKKKVGEAMKKYKNGITVILSAAALMTAIFMTGCTKLSDENNNTSTDI